MSIDQAWRGPFGDNELNALHAAAFGNPPGGDNWWTRVNRHSLGWVCARQGPELVGFVNIAWDGGSHAFILDPVVAPRLQRHGLGGELIAVAADEVRKAGCDWLHVDFAEHLRPFYLGTCGFTPTNAGLIRLA